MICDKLVVSSGLIYFVQCSSLMLYRNNLPQRRVPGKAAASHGGDEVDERTLGSM